MKLRGVAYTDGYHDYVIRSGGLEVFPRLVAAEHRIGYTRDTVPSGVAALDALVGGGLTRGTSTLVMGPAGSGKSLLASHFVHHAVSRGDRASVFIFDEGIGTYFAGTNGVGLDMERLVDAGRIALVADGTPVQVVGTGTMMLRLRVLAGPHEGRDGWVRKEFVRPR
jgi:circadian clock protein KaiC